MPLSYKQAVFSLTVTRTTVWSSRTRDAIIVSPRNPC